MDAALAGDTPGVLRAFINIGLLSDDEAKGLDPDRLLDFYRGALRDRTDSQPFTYTPEAVAEMVSGTYQPMGPWYDVTRRLQMPQDLLYLNRITIGASSVLGHLYATADWKSIDAEIRHHGPPATELGRLDRGLAGPAPHHYPSGPRPHGQPERSGRLLSPRARLGKSLSSVGQRVRQITGLADMVSLAQSMGGQIGGALLLSDAREVLPSPLPEHPHRRGRPWPAAGGPLLPGGLPLSKVWGADRRSRPPSGATGTLR